MVKFSVKMTGLDAMFGNKRRAMVSALRRELSSIDTNLVSQVQKKLSGNPIKSHTNKLFSSVRALPVEQSGPLITGTVEAGGGPAFYAKFLEDGTRPHIIAAKNAKALAFTVGGTKLFRKSVHHPGTPAYRFMAGTLEENRSQIVSRLKAAVRRGSR